MTDKRVFHIDRECYVVFIGATKQDVRPFIRIGNSPHVPEEVTDEIRDVVITDRLTGNPIREQAIVEQSLGSDIRYLGDPDMVARFKTFVGHDDLPTEQFETTTREEKPEAEHSLVYFYRDGGMSIYVGQDKIFSLSDAEKRDRHYIELTRRIKSEFLKDPLRIQKNDLQGSGFIVSDSLCMFFRDGHISAVPVTPDSFLALAKNGIDPDLVTVWSADTISEEIVRLFKRTRLKRASLSILYPEPDEIAPLARLFESSLDGPSANIHTFGPEERVQRGGLQYARDANSSSIQVTGNLFVDSIQVGGQSPDTASMVLAGGNPPRLLSHTYDPPELTLLNAVPYTVANDPEPGERTLSARYLSAWTPFVRAHVDSSTMLLVEQIDQLFARPPQGRARDQLVKSIEQRVKALGAPVPGPLAVYLHNTATALALRGRRGGADAGRAMNSLTHTLSQYRNGVSQDDIAEAPSRADLYITDTSLSVFFKPASPTMSVRNVEHSREVRASLEGLAEEDLAAYERERKELLDLLQRLRRGGSAAAVSTTAGSASKSAQENKKKDSSDKKDSAEKTQGQSESRHSPQQHASDSPQTARGTTASGGVSASIGASGSSASESRSRSYIGIAALLLLLIGAGILFLPGVRERIREAFVSTEIADAQPADPADVDDASEIPMDDATVDAADADPGADADTGDTPADTGETPTVVDLDDNGRNVSVDGSADRFIDPRLQAAGLYEDIPISIADLIRITNRIAVDSGFREMGDPPAEGPDPDFVLPGTILTLPDRSQYQIVSGDYIWLIAARAIRDNIETVFERYEELVRNVVISELSQQDRVGIADSIEDLADDALSNALNARLRQAAAIVRRDDD